MATLSISGRADARSAPTMNEANDQDEFEV
jgi:hypothetical protein